MSVRSSTCCSSASQDEIPIDPAFAGLLLARLDEQDQRGLVFPSHVTGRSYHAGILQQKILRPKGKNPRARSRIRFAPVIPSLRATARFAHDAAKYDEQHSPTRLGILAGP